MLKVALYHIAEVNFYNSIVSYLESLHEYDGSINPTELLLNIFDISEDLDLVEAYLKNFML